MRIGPVDFTLVRWNTEDLLKSYKAEYSKNEKLRKEKQVWVPPWFSHLAGYCSVMNPVSITFAVGVCLSLDSGSKWKGLPATCPWLWVFLRPYLGFLLPKLQPYFNMKYS